MHPMKALLAAAAALAAGQAVAACFTVYDRNNTVLYNAQTPPVDMSRPLHETLPQKYPGGHLVFNQGASDCPIAHPRGQLRVPSSSTGRSPLLTDAATARAMGLKHTVLPSGAAVVHERPDNMKPGVITAESGLPPQDGPDTRMMGAGPARQVQRGGPVITEMHNPPMTSVQPGANRSR